MKELYDNAKLAKFKTMYKVTNGVHNEVVSFNEPLYFKYYNEFLTDCLKD